MKTKGLFLFLVMPILLLAAGCVPECTPEEIQNFDIYLQSPADGALVPNVNGAYTASWTHQESCQPSYYKITTIREDGDTAYSWQLDGETTTYKIWLDLAPGFSYQWQVQAALSMEEDGKVGPNDIFGPSSASRTFTADGICSPEELVPPDPLSPVNGESIDGGPPPGLDHYIIDWNYPADCFPETFHYQVAADPNFLNMITSGQLIFKDFYISSNYPVGYYFADIPVPGCAKIYWRIEARTGNDSGGFSETREFTYYTDPNCFLNQQPGPAALIKGYVFADYCKNTQPWIPEGVEIWPPCVFDATYGVHADGNRNHSAGENENTGETIPFESGIPEVIVDLGSGPCSSTGLDQMVTMANGGYYFMVPSPGEYCLSVSEVTNPGLENGIWTKPLTSNPVTQTTISVDEGESLFLQNFGWDQNDFVHINFQVDLLSNCRAGDSKDYPSVALVEKDTVIPIFARNEDSTWFASKVDDKLCFISISSGAPEEDPEVLMIYPAQPPPPQEEPSGADQPAGCSAYNTSQSCLAHGCTWINFAAGGTCTGP